MSTEPFDTNLHSSTAESPEEFYKGEYLNRLSLKNRFGRIIWSIVYLVLFRLTPVAAPIARSASAAFSAPPATISIIRSGRW